MVGDDKTRPWMVDYYHQKFMELLNKAREDGICVLAHTQSSGNTVMTRKLPEDFV